MSSKVVATKKKEGPHSCAANVQLLQREDFLKV